MAGNLILSETHFDRFFPYYILVNRQMDIASIGSQLQTFCGDISKVNFNQHFGIENGNDFSSFEQLMAVCGKPISVICHNQSHTQLKGLFDYLPENDQIVFTGTPTAHYHANEGKLDLPANDPLRDAVKLQPPAASQQKHTTDEDLKYLFRAALRQKKELQEATDIINNFALFSTQNPDPLIRIDFSGEVIQNNPTASGLDFIEVEGKTYRNDDFFKLIASSIDTTKARWTIEARSGKTDYSFVCISMKEEGYINIYGRDITQNKKNRLQLERLSLIVQQTVNAVIITDAAGKVEWVNKGFETVTGFTLAEVLGKIPGHVLQGKDTDPATAAYIKNQIKKAESFSCEIYNYKKTGEGYWLRINGQPVFDNAGNVTSFFAIEEDITKEREAEQKLKEFDKRLNVALEKIGDNVWEHDFLSEQTSFSQEEYKLFGYASETFKSNAKLWYSSVHPDDKELVKAQDLMYKAGSIDSHSLEYRIIHKNGTVKWVLDRGVVIEKQKDGKPAKIIGTHSDITQQKENEKELEATATRLSSLIANLHAGILLESDIRTVKLANRQFCKMFNLQAEPAALIGMDCSKTAEQSKHFFAKPDEFVTGINTLLANRKTVTGQRLQLVDGRFFERDFIPIWNDGRYDGHLWVYVDITEKINADKKLEEQRRFYEDILDNIPADIAVFDNQHYYQYVNPVAIKDEKIRKWIVGKRDEDYIEMRKKPASIAQERRKVFNSILKSKKLKSWEEQLPKPDGSTNIVLRNLYPVLDEAGDVSFVIGYGVDITNIKNIQQQVAQSEKKYRDVIDNGLAIVTTHDIEGRFITVNPMVGKIFGYSDEEMIGHYLYEFIPKEDVPFFHSEYLAKIIVQKKYSGIFRVKNKYGGIIYTLYNNFLKEEEGKAPYIIAFAVDITDRIEAEKELKIAKKITEDMAQTKQNFLANMSHEIRTPMNAIMGMSQQLEKTLLSSQQQVYLHAIKTSSENLLVIINDILDLSKLEAGKLSLEKIGFEPRQVINRIIQVMVHKAEEKGLSLTNSYFDARLSPVLIGDPYRINQVLLNLVSNSIKFTDTGFIDISIELLSESPTQQQVQITVADTGIGMEEGFAKNLFQKFSQEDESVARRFGGTGLGLSICKQLVNLMQGEISVQSTRGEGTTCKLIVSFLKGAVIDLPQKNIAPVNVGILKGKKILLVDDNEMNRLVASTILEQYGVLITEAINGAEAVALLRTHQFHLVLMDIQMPVLNGLEATAVIRNELASSIPVIALTANAIRGENQKCFDAGMNDYLSKPFEESQLLQIVSQWLKSENKSIENTGDAAFVPAPPLYDMAELIQLSSGNYQFIHKMLRLFIQEVPATIVEIKKAVAKSDIQAVQALAHRIKPSVSSMGIKSLKTDIEKMEQQAGQLLANGQLNDLVIKLENTIDSVVLALEQEMTAMAL